jgi:hypothetical protein
MDKPRGKREGEDEIVTNLVAPKRMRVDAAHLPPAKKMSIKKEEPAAAPLLKGGDVEEMRRRCTLYRLLTDNSVEGLRELSGMVVIAKDCLTQQEILPVNTSDDNDAREADMVMSKLRSDRYRPVFKRCYLLGVLTICPLFYNVLTTRYNVNAAKLDAFVNDPVSRFSIDYNNYTIGKIKDANMLVARAAMMWLQFGGPTPAPGAPQTGAPQTGGGGMGREAAAEELEIVKK